MSGSVIDLVLLLLMVMFAINGYRQGFLVGLLSFVGFFGGALLGLQLGPLLAEQFFSSDQARVVVSLSAVFGLAVAGQALASFVGNRLRNAIVSRNAQAVDNAGGAVVSVVAVLLVVWLVAAPLSTSSLPWLARSVSNSIILNVVDKAMPAQADALSQALRDTVDTRGFPDVFDGLSPTRVKEVSPPDPKLAGSELVKSAKKSVVKVLGQAPSCSRRIEGSGFVYSQNRVMTNAHVVAGTKTVSVLVDGSSRPLPATVVAYDPKRDIAVLYVKSLNAPVLPFAAKKAESNDDAIVLGYPLDGPYDAQSARIRDHRDITGPDIYDKDKVTREIYTIRALVRSGNSGGPLLSTDGEVIGVIFAAAADDPQTGFAVTADEASQVAEAGKQHTDPTQTGECA
ncbi:MarP family serine protease [Dactylosporangium sp. NPDC000244]|uniref:MarP family serine protease n=1 Tax=Dactylosporangium sp. NPDC000244 TaxID=3154365 RepID=UPI0033183911